jgi:hypothetical protein
MTFKRYLFQLFSTLLLVGQISLSYFVFSAAHISLSDSNSFWLSWFLPILLSLLVFFLVFIVSIVVSGSKNIGCGSWYLTLPDMLTSSKDFRKVYHAELGYFILYIDPTGQISKISLFKQDTLRLKHLNDFSVDKPEILKEKIKKFLDKEYQDLLKLKENKKITLSKIEKIKEWDGFLDVVSKRDEKINQILK